MLATKISWIVLTLIKPMSASTGAVPIIPRSSFSSLTSFIVSNVGLFTILILKLGYWLIKSLKRGRKKCFPIVVLTPKLIFPISLFFNFSM